MFVEDPKNRTSYNDQCIRYEQKILQNLSPTDANKALTLFPVEVQNNQTIKDYMENNKKIDNPNTRVEKIEAINVAGDCETSCCHN